MNKEKNLGKKVAEVLLETEAVKLSVDTPFTFVSGIKSPIYCDNRVLIGSLKRDIIIKGFIETLKDLEFDVIAGTATAGIPWAAFIADRLSKPMCYIRSEKKAHGAGKKIEGAQIKGKKVVLIEDLISTGGSSIRAAQDIVEEGGTLIKLVAIFSYGFEKADKSFKEENISYATLSNFGVLMSEAVDKSYITKSQCAIASQWNLNPSEWRKKD